GRGRLPWASLESTLKAHRSVRTCFSVLFVLAVALGACGGDDTSLGSVAAGCSINSDCNDPLKYAFIRCHTPCTDSRDCPTNKRCVQERDLGTGALIGNVCQLIDETKCTMNSQCPGLEICGIDDHCRDQCTENKDCMIPNQVCRTHTCIDPSVD